MKFKPKYEITEKMKSALEEIERLKDKIRGQRILPVAAASIRLRASVESIHSSTSIEGNPLSVSEVRKVVLSDRVLTKKEYAEIEVKNYQRALEYIDARRASGGELEMADILELHRIITDRLLDESRNGKLRKNMVYIENQKHEVLYTAAKVEEVEGALSRLVGWVQESRFAVHPAIIAGILHLRIAAIHPFADGNGRTARATTALFLALARYDAGGALELDSYYAAERRDYYAILQRVNGRDFDSSSRADLTPWLEYFLEGFLSSLHVLEAEMRIAKLAEEGLLGEGLLGAGRVERSGLFIKQRAEQDILSFVEKFGTVGISEAEAILPEMSRRSVQRLLKEMVETGKLKREGGGREVRYGRG